MRNAQGNYSRSHANRGRTLENLIDMTHNQYRNSNYADIRKVPSPVKILSVTGNQVKGKLESSTWVDYSGIFNGQAVVFDAKETKIKNFPLKNLSIHQFAMLKSWHEKGAIAFLLICFWIEGKNEPEIYYLRFEQLEASWIAKDKGGSKSIPLQYFRDHCIRVESGNGYAVHYLQAISGDSR